MKKFKPTNEMIEAAKTVFMTMAMVETIKPVVKGYEKKILTAHQFHIAKEWIEKKIPDQIILDPDQTYLLEDADFQVYLQEAYKERDNAGLKVDNPEFCPLLVAETLKSDAEKILIEALEPVTHLKAQDVFCSAKGLENYKKLIDLSLKLLAPFVGNAKEILAF